MPKLSKTIREDVNKMKEMDNKEKPLTLQEQRDNLIYEHLHRFGENNLFRASLDHFRETGNPSGSFYAALHAMLSEHASQQTEALQAEIERLKERLDKDINALLHLGMAKDEQIERLKNIIKDGKLGN
jgi:DNA repair exonuclease SbcCD ATPase subunit